MSVGFRPIEMRELETFNHPHTISEQSFVRVIIPLLAIAVLLLYSSFSYAQFIIEGEELVAWPNIPVIPASDMEEYKLDRDIFKELHSGEQDADAIKAALKQVDALYKKHYKDRSIAELGRSYNAEFIGSYDQLLRSNRIEKPRLRFSFKGVTPEQFQQEIEHPVDWSGVVAYVTYTQMSQKSIRSTLTIIRLDSGYAESFTLVDELHKVAEKHAKQLFDYLYGATFPQYANPLKDKVWLLSPPQDALKPVFYMQAELGCRSQEGKLPTLEELILGEQAGPYHQGIILTAGQFYHTVEKSRYLAGGTLDPRGKVRTADRPHQTARYYCIRNKIAVGK